MVKLKLEFQDFDPSIWRHYISNNEQAGIRFRSLVELGDTEDNRRRLYELNKTCSADIPGRGPFYSYEEYQNVRLLTESFIPAGVILATDGSVWVGMSAVSYNKDKNIVHNEMTGVLREYRRRGIATALKVLSLEFARSLGQPVIYTVHAAANLPMITMNRRLGYTDCT